MAEYTIDKIEYDGNVYKLQDSVSGYITNAGVTKITTTAGVHTAITNAIGAISFSVPTTAAHVGAASASHSHGNITSGGDITATAPTIASGDQIIINDNSASKITNGPTFDGSTTTTALTPKGTWETFSKFSGSYNDLTDKPTIPTLPSNIVNTITTTAGTHTAITSQKGNVSFNVPTKTSHLTNDSGFITTDTNTTYALSGALSSHKFTSTLTTGGSGSGTSTSDFTLAAGTGITITDDTSNRKMTIACSVTNTDTKVSTAAITSEVSYYPVLGSDTTTAATKFYDKTGFGYTSRIGTASTEGTAVIALGNNISTGTAGNKSGRLLLYGKNNYTASILTDDLTAHTTVKFPNKSGTIALTSDLNSYLKKPTGDNSFGWKLTSAGTDTPVWNPPETFIISVTDDSDNPGSYTLINTPDDIREAWNSGSAFILDLNMYNSSTAYFDTYRIMNYAIQYQSEGYHVLSFNGNINYYDATTQYTTVKTVVCTIYLDENEQYRTDGEVFVKINDDVAINGDIIVRGHDSPIGDRVQKEGGTDWTTNVPKTGYTTAGTWYQLGTISLTKGRWIIIARARFTPETSGNHYSSINISTTPRLEAVRDRKYGTGTYYNQHSTAMIVGLAEDAIVCVNGTSSVSGVWTRTNNSAFTIDAIRIM